MLDHGLVGSVKKYLQKNHLKNKISLILIIHSRLSFWVEITLIFYMNVYYPEVHHVWHLSMLDSFSFSGFWSIKNMIAWSISLDCLLAWNKMLQGCDFLEISKISPFKMPVLHCLEYFIVSILQRNCKLEDLGLEWLTHRCITSWPPNAIGREEPHLTTWRMDSKYMEFLVNVTELNHTDSPKSNKTFQAHL